MADDLEGRASQRGVAWIGVATFQSELDEVVPLPLRGQSRTPGRREERESVTFRLEGAGQLLHQRGCHAFQERLVRLRGFGVLLPAIRSVRSSLFGGDLQPLVDLACFHNAPLPSCGVRPAALSLWLDSGSWLGGDGHN